jgi:anaerobic magnesium-protoporphyrin IX monomethyl ester cyclase
MPLRLPKLALIYPPVTEKYAAMRDLGLSPPLHLLALAAVVQADIRILDGAHLGMDAMLSALAEFAPDVVGMNVDLTNYENAIILANATNARVILGGNYAAFMAKPILARQPRVEAVCYNDGEEALAGFLKGDLSAPNLIHRGGANPVHLLNIGKHPTPAYHLVDLAPYFKKQQDTFGPGFRMLQFYGQKGCVNSPHCSFCGRYEDGMRLRDPVVYSEEVRRHVLQYQLTEVWDRSDSYLQSRRWFSAVQERLRGLPVTFKTYARADQLDAENVRLMKEMGFRMVYIGYEAGDDTLLRLMHKRETTQQYLDATRRVCEAGIEIDASFIIGLQGESPTTLKNQVQFVKDLAALGVRKIKVNRVLVLPGTPLFARVCAKFPEVSTLDTLDNDDLQRKLYSTYDLSGFDGVDGFVHTIDEVAQEMAGIVRHHGGSAEGYGYNRTKTLAQ